MKNLISNPLFLSTAIFLLVFIAGLIAGNNKIERDTVGYVIETKHALLNKRSHSKEILEAYKECVNANKNRDVVYNDTNELANTCKTYSLNLYDANDEKYVPSVRSKAFQELEKDGKL